MSTSKAKPRSGRDTDAVKAAKLKASNAKAYASPTRDDLTLDTDEPKFTGITKDTSRMADKTIESDPTYWREKAKRRRVKKFNDARKAVFLASLEQGGKIVIAIEDAKVSRKTIDDHRKADPLFDDACVEALETYAKKIIRKIEDRALDGYDNPIFDKDGNKVGTKTTFETQLAIKMLPRYDEDYRDKSALDVTTGGGMAIVVPPTLPMEAFAIVAAAARVKMLADQKKREDDDAQG